jgi:hypothetical protein
VCRDRHIESSQDATGFCITASTVFSLRRFGYVAGVYQFICWTVHRAAKDDVRVRLGATISCRMKL